MRRVKAIEFLMRHTTEPWMGVERIGVLLEFADTCFEKSNLRAVIEIGGRNEHARGANTANRVPGEKPR